MPGDKGVEAVVAEGMLGHGGYEEIVPGGGTGNVR